MQENNTTMLPLSKHHAVISLAAWCLLFALGAMVWVVDAHPWLFPPYKPEVVTILQVAGTVIAIGLLIVRASYEARLVTYFRSYDSPYIKSALHILYIALPLLDLAYLIIGRPCEVYPIQMEVFPPISAALLAKEVRKTYFCSILENDEEYCLLIATPIGEVNLMVREQGVIDLFVLGEGSSLPPDTRFPGSGWRVEYSQSGDYAFVNEIAVAADSNESKIALRITQEIAVIIKEAGNSDDDYH